MKRRKNNGNNKKKIIVIVGSVILILVVGIIVTLLLSNKKEVKTKKVDKIKSSWGNIYYTYLKDIKKNDKYDKAGLSKDLDDGEVRFYDIDNIDDPVMGIEYEVEDKDYLNIYYINNKKVDVIIYKEPTDIDYYYNIQEDKYDYYTNTIKDDANNYISVKDQINSKLDSNSDDVKVYTFKDSEVDSVKDSDGKDISLTKFDETFIKIDDDIKKIDFNISMSDKKLKNMINSSIDNYNKSREILTDEVKESVDKKKEEIKNTRTNIDNIKKKKKEEEERIAREKALAEKALKEKEIQEQKKNDSNGLLTQAQADDIVKKKYNLDSKMSSQENGYVTSFASYGLVTYQGDNQKYYYYSSFNILEDHSSYNGSFIVNAKTGKIKYVAYISRTAPDNGVVPSSSGDQDIN